MAVAGLAPSCVPWTVQLFGRVMLTESKKASHFASFDVSILRSSVTMGI